jgi:hypothetical protein
VNEALAFFFGLAAPLSVAASPVVRSIPGRGSEELDGCWTPPSF